MYSSILIPKQINLRYLFFYNCLQLSITISIQAKPVFGIKIRSTIEHTEDRLNKAYLIHKILSILWSTIWLFWGLLISWKFLFGFNMTYTTTHLYTLLLIFCFRKFKYRYYIMKLTIFPVLSFSSPMSSGIDSFFFCSIFTHTDTLPTNTLAILVYPGYCKRIAQIACFTPMANHFAAIF